MNAIEYRETRTDAILAVLGSFFLHFLLFLFLIIWLSLAGYMIAQELDETPVKEEQVIVLSPEYFKREEPQPMEEVKKRFAETNPAIPTETVEEADLIGERSTLAASETILDQGDPDLPTQMTREEKEQELPNTFNSDFVDAEIDVAPAPESQETPEQSLERVEQSEQIAQTEEEGEEAEETLPAEALPEKEELLETPDQIEIPKEEEAEEEIKEPEEESAETLAEKQTEGQNESAEGLPKPKKETQESTPGFQTEQRKTRIIGSLSRGGASSLEVQQTALGQYYAQISKIIERKWQANCLQYREHIQPGVISMQFYVDGNGKVSNPRPHDVVSTSPIQVGFTMKAIRASKLPPMPAAARKELGEEQLELIYNFYF